MFRCSVILIFGVFLAKKEPKSTEKHLNTHKST